MIKLGSTVKDKITGFTGIVTGYVSYISGCNQALIIPRVGDDGKLIEAEWLDEQRLDLLDDPVITLDNGDNPGFDRTPPKR